MAGVGLAAVFAVFAVFAVLAREVTRDCPRECLAFDEHFRGMALG